MHVVALRPLLRVAVVGVRDQAREVGLLVAGGSVVEREEGEREAGDADVKEWLYISSQHGFLAVCCAREPTPKVSVPEGAWWASPGPWEGCCDSKRRC